MTKVKSFVAVHLFLLQENQVLLLRRCNTDYMDGMYSVVAGHVEAGENVIQAMHREAKEEAGITIDEADLHITQVMHRKSDTERIDYFFIATKWQGEIQNGEPNKCDDLSWFDIDKLPDNMIPYVRYAIGASLQDQKFTLYGW